MANLAPYIFFQELDNNGDPLSGGKIYSYEAGSSTPKDTYTDSSGTVANTNPIILDSSGRAAVWLGDGGYKFVLKDSDDVLIETRDNIGGSSSSAFGAQVNDISTNTLMTSVYANSVNICTGTITLSLLEVSSAGEGFYLSVRNDGSGVVTIDPDGAETINGEVSLDIAAGQSALIICDGDEWFSIFQGSLAASEAEVAAGTEDSKFISPLAAAQVLWSTGDAKLTFKTSADTGWVMADDGSIGSAASSATNRANADTEALYTLLWTNVSNTYAPVSGGRGGSAAADFAANKTLTLTKMLGHAIGVAGAGSGLTSRALGQTVGAETHTLTAAQSGLPAHTHPPATGHSSFLVGATGGGGISGSGVDTVTTTGSNATQNASQAHNNMQPTIFMNVMIKL